MKSWKILTGILVVAAGAMYINTATASATANVPCDIPKLKLGEPYGQNMTINGNKLTANFTVTGENCKTPVTLAVWKTPSANGQPFLEQKLFAYTTKTFGPGKHSITATLPDCYWQVDLLTSDKPTAPDGTPMYAFQNGKILEVHPLRDFKFGGSKKCTEPEPEKDVCPNIEGMQTEVPEGYKKDDKGNCVIIPAKPKPEKPQVEGIQTGGGGGQQVPEALPSTGPGAIVGTFMGMTVSAGAAHAIVQRFRRR